MSQTKCERPAGAIRVAVTGATSDFAAAIIPRLLHDRAVVSVVGVCRGAARLRLEGYEHVRMDVRNPELVKVFAGCDTVVHLAFIVEELHDKELTHSINIDGSVNVVQSCAAAGVTQLVFASSINAYGSESRLGKPLDEMEFARGDRFCGYAHDKALVEHYLEWWLRRHPDGMSIATLRPTYVVGPNFSNAGIAALCAPVGAIANADQACFQFLHEDDLAEAFCIAIHRGLSGTYNVGPNDWTPVRQLAKAHGQRLVSIPRRFGRYIANLLFALRLTPYSGEWVTAGEPIVNSLLYQQTSGWSPTLTSDEAAAVMLLRNGRHIIDPSAVPKRHVACEAALAVVSERARSLLAATGRDPAQLDEALQGITHAFTATAAGALVHVEHHQHISHEANTNILIVPAAGIPGRCYSHLAAALEHRGRVAIVDRPGSGLSVQSRARHSSADLYTAIECALDQLGGQRKVYVLMFGTSLSITAIRRKSGSGASIGHSFHRRLPIRRPRTEWLCRRLLRQHALTIATLRVDPYDIDVHRQVNDAIDKLINDVGRQPGRPMLTALHDQPR
jgi:UDP-glucose 4-epimerase